MSQQVLTLLEWNTCGPQTMVKDVLDVADPDLTQLFDAFAHRPEHNVL
ncbi:MAG: hypothetical protein IIA09_13040 [Proteobacteria bacterium]|nr:hypothetical protein [Pseudomonadota bacterium]